MTRELVLNEQLAIGYIHNGQVTAPFMRSMMELQGTAAERGEYYRMLDCHGMFVAANRSRVADVFLDETSAEWLLFIDTDVGFEVEMVNRLLSYGDAQHQIIAGLCFTWLQLPDGSKVLGPNWWERNAAGEEQTVIEIRQDRLNPLSYCGMAFTLIGRTVLTEVRKAYKHFVGLTTFGYDILHIGNTVTLGGEDISFCKRAEYCGFSTWGAGDVTVDHYKQHMENLQTFSMLYGPRK